MPHEESREQMQQETPLGPLRATPGDPHCISDRIAKYAQMKGWLAAEKCGLKGAGGDPPGGSRSGYYGEPRTQGELQVRPPARLQIKLLKILDVDELVGGPLDFRAPKKTRA